MCGGVASGLISFTLFGSIGWIAHEEVPIDVIEGESVEYMFSRAYQIRLACFSPRFLHLVQGGQRCKLSHHHCVVVSDWRKLKTESTVMD